MGCEIKSFNEQSVSELATYLNDNVNNGNEKLTTEHINYFRSEGFKKEFGDYEEGLKLNYKKEYKSMKSRVDSNGEPLIKYNDTAKKHYFLDKNNQQVYFPLIEKGLRKAFTSEQISEISSIIASEYFETSGIDFNNIDFNGNEKLPGLDKFVEEELIRKHKELSESKNRNDRSNSGSIEFLIKNKEELTKSVNDFFKYISIKIVDNNDIDEDVDEYTSIEELKETVKDPSFNTSSAERSSKDAVGSNVKLRLSLLKDNININKLWNKPKFLPFNMVYGDLLAILSDTTTLDNENTWDLYREKLNLFIEKKPFIQTLIDGFEKTDNKGNKLFTEDNINEFIQAFNLTRNNHIQTDLSIKQNALYNEAGQIDIVNGKVQTENAVDSLGNKIIKSKSISVSESGSKTKATESEWFINFKNLFLNKDGKPKSNTSLDLVGISGKFILLEKKITNTTEFKQSLIRGLSSIGITVSEKGLDNYIDNFGKNISNLDKNEALVKLVSATKTQLSNISKATNSLVKAVTRNLISESAEFRKLARAESFFISDGSDATSRQGGKNRYLNSKKSYLSNTIGKWKKGQYNELKKLNDNIDYNGEETPLEALLNSSAWTKNSYQINFLLGKVDVNGELIDFGELSPRELRISQLTIGEKRLENFDLAMFNQISGNGKYKATTDISFNDYLVDDINKTLSNALYETEEQISKNSSHSRGFTPADKTMEFQIKTGTYIQSTDFEEDKNIISKVALKQQVKYFFDEFNRMIEAKTEVDNLNDNELVPNYHYNKSKTKKVGTKTYNGNAFKSQIYNRLSPSTKNLSEIEKSIHDLLYINGLPNGKELIHIDENNNPELKDYQLSELINNYIETELLKGVNKTYSTLKSQKIIALNNENNYVLTNIDENIIKKYNEEYSMFGDEAAGLAMATDYYVNSIVKNIEYTKMFNGDVAYYKNPIDFKKRVPAIYTDGLQLNVSPNQLRFKIATISDVVIDSPFSNELKSALENNGEKFKDIDSTDAQAWITPERWKFILKGLGKWSSGKDSYESVYKKMTSNKKEEYSVKELKIAAQPLKGVYFGRNENGKPIFLKYSQAVLTSDLVKGTGLEKIYNNMVNDSDGNKLDYDNQIHEVITFSGIKVGSMTPDTIHNEDGTIKDDFSFESTQMLNNKDWKLQQDLPTKNFKMTDVGSQIQKNIFAGLLFLREDNNFQLDGRNVSGREVMDGIIKTVMGLTNNGLENVKKQFNIKDDYVIGDVKGFYSEIIKQLEDRKGSENIIDALKAEIAIPGIPQAAGKLHSIFSSMMTDKLIKIKTNGGSFIQMSNFGLSKNEAVNQKIIMHPDLEDGKTLNEPIVQYNSETGKYDVTPGGVFISGSFIAKAIPDYKNFTPTQLFVGENGNPPIIDKKITENLIGYRIPNQGLASNDFLKILGIIPEGNGDTVVAYTGITKKTGSDFDIDKMFIMFPSYTAEYKDIERKESGLATNLKYISSNGTSNESLGNRLIELYKSTLSHPKVYNKMMNPIDSPFISDEIKMLTDKDESEESLGIYDPVDDIKLRYSFLEGKSGVGIEANSIVDISREGELSFEKTFIGWGNVNELGETLLDREFSEELSKEDLDYYVDVMSKKRSKDNNFDADKFREEIKKVLIGDSLTAILNAFVDIAKDPYITKGNWGTSTTNVGNLLLRSGMHPILAVNFMAQPIIRDYIDYQKGLEGLMSYEDSESIFKFKKDIVLKSFGNDNLVIVLNEKLNNEEITKEEFDLEANKLKNSSKILKNIYEKYFNRINSSYNTYQLKLDNRNGYITNKQYDSLLDEMTYKSLPLLKDVFKEIYPKEEFDPNNLTIINKTIDLLFSKHNKVFNYQKINNFSGELNGNKLNLQYYRNQIIGKSDSEFQMNILDKFKELRDLSTGLRNNVNVSKIDTDLGKNVNSMFAAENTKQFILSKEGELGSLKGFETKFDNTTLNVFYNQLKWVLNVVRNNPLMFPQAQSDVQDVFNEISYDLYDQPAMNTDLMLDLDTNYNSFLMANILKIKDDELINLLTEFPSEFQAFKTANKTQNGNKYYMFNDLNVSETNIQKPFSAIELNNRAKDFNYSKSFTDSWQDLYNDNPVFAEKLIKYSFASTSFKMTSSQFYTFIPYQYFIEKDINNEVKDFSNESKSEFIDAFYRNNISNNKYVKALSVEKDAKVVALNDKIDISNGFIVEGSFNGKYFVTYKKNYYKLEGFKESIDGINSSPIYVAVNKSTITFNDKELLNYNSYRTISPYKFKDTYQSFIDAVVVDRNSIAKNLKSSEDIINDMNINNNISKEDNSLNEITEKITAQEDTNNTGNPNLDCI